jgi:hypothetical protein
LNGWKARFGSLKLNVALPPASTIAAAGALPRSQWINGDHPGVVGATPSHCSTKTCVPGV